MYTKTLGVNISCDLETKISVSDEVKWSYKKKISNTFWLRESECSENDNPRWAQIRTAKVSFDYTVQHSKLYIDEIGRLRVIRGRWSQIYVISLSTASSTTAEKAKNKWYFCSDGLFASENMTFLTIFTRYLTYKFS